MSEDQHPKIIDSLITHEAPQPSPAVGATYDTLREVTHEHIAIRPDVELTALVHDFGKGLIPTDLYEVSMLTTIGNRLGDPVTKVNAKRALATYREHATPEQYEGVTDLLPDFAVIDMYTEYQLAKHLHSVADHDSALHDVFDRTRHNPVEPLLWRVEAGLPSLKDLLDLAKEVNLETILIKACEALRKLSDENTPDAELYRTLFIVENTYEPLCEIIGLDAFAATLKSQADLIRLQKSGQDNVIASARRALDAMGATEEVAEFTKNLPEIFLGESLHEPVINNSSGHEIVFSMAYSHIETESFVGDVKVLLRVKSLGSTARKIAREGEIPADLIGVTVVTDTAAEVGTIYAHVIAQLSEMQQVKFVPAPSRDAPLHAKGSKEFITTIKNSLAAAGIDKKYETKEHNGGFEYAKFTVDWNHGDGRIMPLEVQFMHADSRTESRIGADGHVLFKYFKLHDETREGDLSLEEAVEHMKEIHDRISRFNPTKLTANGSSRKRGELLRHSIELKSPSASSKWGQHIISITEH